MRRSPPLFMSSNALLKEFWREHLKTRGSTKYALFLPSCPKRFTWSVLSLLRKESLYSFYPIVNPNIPPTNSLIRLFQGHLRVLWHSPSLVTQDDQLLEDSKTLGDCGFTNQTARPQAPATVGLAFRISGMHSLITQLYVFGKGCLFYYFISWQNALEC